MLIVLWATETCARQSPTPPTKITSLAKCDMVWDYPFGETHRGPSGSGGKRSSRRSHPPSAPSSLATGPKALRGYDALSAICDPPALDAGLSDNVPIHALMRPAVRPSIGRAASSQARPSATNAPRARGCLTRAVNWSVTLLARGSVCTRPAVRGGDARRVTAATVRAIRTTLGKRRCRTGDNARERQQQNTGAGGELSDKGSGSHVHSPILKEHSPSASETTSDATCD